jgi:hypothetical protein
VSGTGSSTIANDFMVDTNSIWVDSAANRVGIAKSNPSVTLDVGGRANVDQTSAAIGLGGFSGSTHVWSLSRFNTPTNASLSISALGGIGLKGGQSGNASSAFHLMVSSTGLVGVGTTTPRNLFHVSAGASGTTTIEYGDPTNTSKVCINSKNSAGAEIRMYVNGTTQVIELGRCT